MSESKAPKPPSKEVLITMLRFALIEIRSSDQLEVSKRLADIFHILPAQLLMEWDDEVNLKAYEQILNRAARCGLERYINDLQITAEKSLTK